MNFTLHYSLKNEIEHAKNMASKLDWFKKMDIDKLKTVEKIKKEIERFQKFNFILGNEKLKTKLPNIDIKNYAKYILLEGTKQEKRDLLECMKNKIYLKDKLIYLIN